MADNKFISVSYELYSIGEEETPVLIEKTNAQHPFTFVSGMGYTLPDFEAQVVGLAAGDKFDFVIPQDQAYGPYMEEHVKELPKDIFRGGNGHFDAETIFPGNIIPLMNEDGMRFDGCVLEVKTDSVVIDLNHPLAGCDLRFTGSIVDLHEATAEEISQFVNGMSCGCGGDCGGECGGECGHDHDHCGCGHDHGDGHCGCGHHH